MSMIKSKNSEILASFAEYCEEHPDERFWQALFNWARVGYILLSDKPAYAVQEQLDVASNFFADDLKVDDPYNWEGKGK
jgi:hypothetical protein